MKLTLTVITMVLPSSSLGALMMMMASKRAATGEVIEVCPNPNMQDLDSTITCLNYTNPTTPKYYGQRDTCISLEGSPLRVGSPQGISSVRMYGTMNCTLYKTENCEPDTPLNGHVVEGPDENQLYRGTGPDDPDAVDDKTVAFRCRKLGAQKLPTAAIAAPFLEQ